MDDRGKCTNLLYFLPPQFSIFCGWQQGQSPGNSILSLKWLSILWVKCFQMSLEKPSRPHQRQNEVILRFWKSPVWYPDSAVIASEKMVRESLSVTCQAIRLGKKRRSLRVWERKLLKILPSWRLVWTQSGAQHAKMDSIARIISMSADRCRRLRFNTLANTSAVMLKRRQSQVK